MVASDWKDALKAIKVPRQRPATEQVDEFLTLDDIVTVKKDSLQRELHRVGKAQGRKDRVGPQASSQGPGVEATRHNKLLIYPLIPLINFVAARN